MGRPYLTPEQQELLEEQLLSGPLSLEGDDADALDELAPTGGGRSLDVTVSRTGPVAQSGPPRDYSGEAARFESVDPEGGKHLFGVDRELFDRQKRIEAARAAYGDSADPTPSTRWEDEFRSSRYRPTDDDARRAWISSLLFGQFGDQKAAEEMRRARIQEGYAYDQALGQARDRDTAYNQVNQRVSRGLAEAIAATGMVSPEDAVTLKMGDPIVKAFQSGGYAQGLRERGQDLDYLRHLESLIEKRLNGEERANTATETTRVRAESSERAAAIRAAAKKGAGHGAGAGPATGPTDDETVRYLIRYWQGRVPPETVEGIVRGTIDPATQPNAAQAKQILADANYYRAQARDEREKMNRANDAMERQDIHLPDRAAETAAVTVVARARNDPKVRYQLKDEITGASMTLRNAILAWKQMSPEGRLALVQLAPQGLTVVVRSAKMSSTDRAAAGAVLSAINELVKARSGSAVTESEWGRVASEIGLSGAPWDPFNDPAALEGHLARARERVMAHGKQFDEEFGWDRVQ